MSLLKPIRGLTVHQPYAYLLARGWKPLENRDWPPWPSMRDGWVAIHAGLKFDNDEVVEIWNELHRQGLFRWPAGEAPLTTADLRAQCGHILGVGRIARVVEDRTSPWRTTDRYGWVFDPMVRLSTPVKHTGGQGLWTVEPKALAKVRAGWRAASRSRATAIEGRP